MKAILHEKYGPVEMLKVAEIEKPEPRPDEVLVRIKVASVNAADWRIVEARPFIARLAVGLFKPKNPIPGVDFAGRVEAVGKDVVKFKPGDDVFGSLIGKFGGCFAEYACAAENVCVRIPAGITYEAAAAMPLAGTTALHGVRDHAKVGKKQKVLINGAGGGVGTYAVQIAKALGAEVTAVTSTGKMDMVRSIGADHVIDYTREDFTKSDQKYDVIFDASGSRSLFEHLRALKKGGMLSVAGMTGFVRLFTIKFLGPFARLWGKNAGVMQVKKYSTNDVEYIADLMRTGKVISVIDRSWPLEGAAQALRYVEDGRATGKVVIIMPHE